MKVFRILLSVSVLLGPQSSYLQAFEPHAHVCQESESLPNGELDFDKMLNLDELEDELVKMNIFDTIKPIPPHPIIVWIRIIGIPIANAYFAVRRVFRNSVSKIAAFFHLKSAKSHEKPATV